MRDALNSLLRLSLGSLCSFDINSLTGGHYAAPADFRAVGLGLTLTGVRCLWDKNDQLTEELRTQRFIMSISSCLVPSPFSSPAPRFCPALPLSILPVSYLLPVFPHACLQYLFTTFTVAFCLLDGISRALFVQKKLWDTQRPQWNALCQQRHCTFVWGQSCKAGD